MRTLVLYTRAGCHLCHRMRAQLAELEAELGFACREVDVDTDPELVERYGEDVPVLAEGEHEICWHFLDEDRLRRHCAMNTAAPPDR